MSMTKTTIAVLTNQNYQNLFQHSVLVSVYEKLESMTSLGQTDNVVRTIVQETNTVIERDWLDYSAADEWRTFITQKFAEAALPIESYTIVDKTM